MSAAGCAPGTWPTRLGSAAAPRILLLGVGNLLMGDEGVGVHALRRLEHLGLPPWVSLLDGGTGGFHLLSCFDECDVLVLIDATLDDRPPGTVRVFEARRRADFPRSLSAHDIGLRDLFDSAALLGSTTRIFLVTVSVADLQPMQLELSTPIAAALPAVEVAVTTLIEWLSHPDAIGGQAGDLLEFPPRAE